MKRGRQEVFEFKSWGGARKGAGRKRIGAKKSVPHRRREALATRHPVHVTLRVEAGLASLRHVARTELCAKPWRPARAGPACDWCSTL